MAGKQQEQNPVKSGDVLLLFGGPLDEDGLKGYVYSEITPILPEYACVCFYPVRPPYSKEDPGLPDVNCATFTVRLVSEKKRDSTTPIHYGQFIELQHTATRLNLAVSKTTTARCEPNLMVGLEACKESTETNCQFKIVPLHSDHALGSQVRFNQPVKFESVEVPDHYLHSSAQPYGLDFWIQPDRYELNLSSLATPLVMILHHDCGTESYSCRAGNLLQLSETKESLSVIAKGSRFRFPQDYRRKQPELKVPEILDDVCAQDKYTDPGETWYPPSLWQFEEAKDPLSGSFLKFNTDYRIKHTLSRKYLAVVECQHKHKGPDKKTCVDCVKGVPLQVVLKDRTVIQQSDDEEEIVDDIVFTPISPDEQTSTHTVLEGIQLLLQHKKTGKWLNVYHGTLFEWHELLKHRNSGKWSLYDTAPYYEVDADKRLVALANDPFHAFTVHQSLQVSELLYDVAGILGVLITIVTELLASGKVDTMMLEPLKGFANQPKFHTLIAHYGLIELLLTFEGDQLDLAFDVLKSYADKAPLYEKNRFVQLVGSINPVFKAVNNSEVGMDINSVLMLNNKCQWVESAQAKLKLFIEKIDDCAPHVLRILGRLCLCSGKPVTAIQNAIVKEVLQKKEEMFYHVEKQDSSGSIVVVKEETKLLLSELSDQEMNFLGLQLTLFARLCEGGNNEAIEAILDERYGFMSLDGALVCAKNEDQSIPIDIQTEFIYLIRVMLDDSTKLKTTLHTLEPLTWCCVQEEQDERKPLVATAAHGEEGAQSDSDKLKNWIETFSSSPQENRMLLLQSMKLLSVLLKKGHYSGLGVVEKVYKNVLDFLKSSSSVTGHVNCEVIFQLIPLFFQLQLRDKMQVLLNDDVRPSEAISAGTGVTHMALEITVLDEIKAVLKSGGSVPHELLVCYFYSMNIHHDLLQTSTREVHLLNKSKAVFEMAIREYPKLRHHLRSLATPTQSNEIQDLLRELGSKCVFNGIAHQMNQSIFSGIALDDILNCIFDHSASFPMWYWCDICSHAVEASIATSVTVSACFKFLHTLAYSNFKVQKRLVQHLDDILPHCEVFPLQVAQLLVEIFAGELTRGLSEVAEKSVLSHVENIHLKINEKQIKYLLQVATRRAKNRSDGRHLLKALLFIIRYDEADLPIVRNQDFVMRNLQLDDEHRKLLTYWTAEKLESELDITASMQTQSIDYVLTMIDMLATCAEGESLSIDAKCQSIYKTDELLGSVKKGDGILLNPKICPARKTPFLRFLFAVYVDCEGPVRLSATNPFMWKYLKTVVEFLRSFRRDLQEQLAQAEGSADDKRLSVQQSLMNGLRPFGIPGNADAHTCTIDIVIEKNDMKDLGGGLFYLLKGILPMIIEFYRRQSDEQPLQDEHLQTAQDLCKSLWDLNKELTMVIVSSIHLRMYHIAVAAVINSIHKAGATPCVSVEEVDVYDHLSVARERYEEEFGKEAQGSCNLRENLKKAFNWTEENALEKLLNIFCTEDNDDQRLADAEITETDGVSAAKQAESCTATLCSILTWLFDEAPLMDWPIYPYIPGLASKCLKALQRHVENLKKKNYFNRFCQMVTEKEHDDKKSHLEEILSLASASKMEEVSGEALNLLVIMLDSQENPIRKYLGDYVKTYGGHCLHLSDFLLAVHSCIRDSITVSKGRIAVRDEITQRRKLASEVFQPSPDLPADQPTYKKSTEELPIKVDEVRIDFRDSERIQLLEMSSTPFQSTVQLTAEGKTALLDHIDIDVLIPLAKNLASMLKIVAFMCDEQNRPLQDFLKKQPGRINSVNIVGSVVGLLNHIRGMYEDAKLQMPPSENAMEIIALIFQALIEFCAGNYENQEVMVNRQISSDLNWILSVKKIDSCQLNSLKATAVELIENLTEEVAEGVKELVRKLSEDEKLIDTLKEVTEDFNFHVYAHARAQSSQHFFSGVLGQVARVTSPPPTPYYAIPMEGITDATVTDPEIPIRECKRRVKQSRFRAYNIAKTLKQQREELEPAPIGNPTRKKKPPEPPGWKYCRKHSKTIEVFYQGEDTEEPIHTSVSFSYPYEDELQEEVKDNINWSVDRSNPEDKLLDFVRYMQPAKDDIEHQKRLADGKLSQMIRLFSGLRHYALLLLTFILNLIVLFTFTVNPNDIPPPGTAMIPLSDAKVAISPLTSQSSEIALYILGAFHLVLSLWMVVEYFAVTGPHLIRAGWKAALPRFVLAIITKLMQKTIPRWKEHHLSEVLKPADEGKLQQSFYGWNSIYRIVFLYSSLLSLIPPLQGYFYCICLLYIIQESDILWRVLKAVTKNGWSLLWVAFLGLIVLYMYAVLSFAFLHESFFIDTDGEPLHCDDLAQCFVSVIRYGLLDSLGTVIPLISGDFTEFGWRLLYDISFFIIVTTIGLNVIFGIIVDTFSELRDERWTSEQDMNDRCFICSIPNYEFDRQEQNGFDNHVCHDHNMWNYIYYYVYVSRIPPRDRSAIQKYVHDKIEKESIDFFPQKAALKLKDRAAEVTTEDLAKKVSKASRDLEAEISTQSKDTENAVVGKLSKRLPRGDMQKGFQDELQSIRDEMQRKFGDVNKKIGNVQQTLFQEQMLIGQEFAGLQATLKTILDRLPAEGPRP